MKIKSIVISTILTILITGMIVFTTYTEMSFEASTANSVYRVYLDGKTLGLIESEEALYNLINQDQIEIKNTYAVDNVYPPNGFEIVKYNTYDNQVAPVDDIYKTIKEEKQFTVKGYTITVEYAEEENKNPLVINVLDKDLFDEAAKKIVTTFIDVKKFEDFLNNSQEEIIDVGSTIESITWEENIKIRESYIDADQKIFTNVNELSQYLLFGSNKEQETYTVKEGDTIETIAYDNELNTSEFLMANPKFTSDKDLLAVGDNVVIALIDPLVSLSYDMEVVEDVEVMYDSETQTDSTKATSYKETTQKGEKGINRLTKKARFVNGAEQQGGQVVNKVVIKEPVKEITVRGRQSTSSGSGTGSTNIPDDYSGSYVDNGLAWAWPTNSDSYVSSGYGYRWGSFHDGIDITGSGYGSPIYASNSGTVMYSGSNYGGWASGNCIVIDHGNGIYTVYAHLKDRSVQTGQTVSRGQRIGSMGNTGMVSPSPTAANPTAGTHLHFGAFYGVPYQGGVRFNPYSLFS